MFEVMTESLDAGIQFGRMKYSPPVAAASRTPQKYLYISGGEKQ